MVSPLLPYISFEMHHQQLSTDRISFAEFPEEPRVTCLQSYKSILDRSQSTDPSPMQDLHQISIKSKAKEKVGYHTCGTILCIMGEGYSCEPKGCNTPI